MAVKAEDSRKVAELSSQLPTYPESELGPQLGCSAQRTVAVHSQEGCSLQHAGRGSTPRARLVWERMLFSFLLGGQSLSDTGK
jgi:hypothetical protein